MAGRPDFPPGVVVAIKALACELPYLHGLTLSRFSVPEIRREAVERGLVASIGETTVWRWLSEDAIRPWHHRSWLFPRDPDFEQKAVRVLDLYAGGGSENKTGIRDQSRYGGSLRGGGQSPDPGKMWSRSGLARQSDDRKTL